jgi:hypothetical protein
MLILYSINYQIVICSGAPIVPPIPLVPDNIGTDSSDTKTPGNADLFATNLYYYKYNLYYPLASLLLSGTLTG